MTATVSIDGVRAAVEFRPPFDLDTYRTFIAAKGLPEREVEYDWERDAYNLSTAARYAERLDTAVVARAPVLAGLSAHLFDYQAWIVRMAFEARRFAIWADTGLGKTAMFLEWADQVARSTHGRVLILSPLSVIEQTRAEWQRFYPQLQKLDRLGSREDLATWCKEPTPAIGITNYEKLIPGRLPELRYLAGLVADESSLLKTGGGVIKWNLIHSARGIEYKLSCTATPAPNDTMEYASQASFLEKLRSEGEILWTFFTRDKTGTWRVKPHARAAFYQFMASWSIYLRDPAHYGFADILATLPPPEIHEWRLAITDEQRAKMLELQVTAGTGMFNDRLGVRERAKLSQLAKGFLYLPDHKAESVPSLKPAYVAELVAMETAVGRPTLIWTVFDEESYLVADAISAILPNTSVELLDGRTPDAQRAAAIEDFQRGDLDVLISKASLIGYGLNLQACRAMVFSGFDDSFERMYQAIRRAYRFGQTETVHVHVPYIPELEGLIFENVRAKEARFLADVETQERNYRIALGMGS